MLKYRDLAADFQHGMPVTMIPVVFGSMGVVSSRCGLDYRVKIFLYWKGKQAVAIGYNKTYACSCDFIKRCLWRFCYV